MLFRLERRWSVFSLARRTCTSACLCGRVATPGTAATPQTTMPTITLPAGYSLVIGTVVSMGWMHTWQMLRVLFARRAAGIKYPQLYAEKSEAEESPAAMIFNCAQRAHMNTLENTPHVLMGILFTGLKLPYIAAGLGASWVTGRIIYTLCYTSNGPERRLLSAFSQMGLLIAASYTAYQFISDEFQF